METKKCNTCNKVKQLSDFKKDKRTSDGHTFICKTCSAQYERKRRKLFKRDHPTESYQKQLKHNLKYKYGITLEEYDELFYKQHGCCAICSKHQQDFAERFCVEHNHHTGKIRGLVCRTCNHLIDIYESKFYGLEDKVREYLNG